MTFCRECSTGRANLAYAQSEMATAATKFRRSQSDRTYAGVLKAKAVVKEAEARVAEHAYACTDRQADAS